MAMSADEIDVTLAQVEHAAAVAAQAADDLYNAVRFLKESGQSKVKSRTKTFWERDIRRLEIMARHVLGNAASGAKRKK